MDETATGNPDTDPAGGRLGVGTRVEVRNDFDGTWSPGFSVAAALRDGYRLRRRSDDVEVPGVFGFDQVRRERRRATWWV